MGIDIKLSGSIDLKKELNLLKSEKALLKRLLIEILGIDRYLPVLQLRMIMYIWPYHMSYHLILTTL